MENTIDKKLGKDGGWQQPARARAAHFRALGHELLRRTRATEPPDVD